MAPASTAGLVVCTLGLLACGGGRAVEINPRNPGVASRWNATLATPAQLAGASQVRGTGWIEQSDDDSTESRASVSIENAVPGGKHPWHIHLGQCGADRGILGPPDAYEPLEVGGNGRAESTAEIPLPLPTAGQYYVNVHASANNMGTTIACGNLAPPSR
ncbi:MAG: CHRD domain-containing protein [Gemmatimonadales bacterium]|nr:CHRD domain-containing protein [Gemmatimonadales bacterium]